MSAPVVGTVEVGCWREPGEVDVHPDVSTAGLPILAGREPVAF